jgi:Domain of unkown function (DUF1775)
LAKPIVTDDGSFSQAVAEVIWSGGRIRPGQFQSFTISADPMPTGESQVTFKTIQTYSNGDVVRWIDVQQPGQPEPAHPAPVVKLTTTSAAAPASAATTSPAARTSSGFSVLGLAGLLVGVLACLLVLIVARQNRRLTAAASPATTPEEQPAGRVAVGAKASAGRDQVPAGSKASAGRPGAANRKTSSRQAQQRRRRS